MSQPKPDKTEGLKSSLVQINRALDSKELRSTLETLVKIFKNIKLNPGEEKYRVLKLSNARVKSLWCNDGVRRFLVTAGWTKEGDVVTFPQDQDIELPISVLLDNRLVAPDHDAWVPETKLIVSHNDKEKEAEEKKQAAEERKKKLEEYYKEKKKMEDIANSIRAEHKADRKEKRVFYLPAKANQLHPFPDPPEPRPYPTGTTMLQQEGGTTPESKSAESSDSEEMQDAKQDQQNNDSQS